MGTKDPRVDAYIAKSAEFAQPILNHLRELVHATCPEVVETMKWSFPHFDYKGPFVHMASFKAHCAFGFWKGSTLFDDAEMAERAMGQFGRITSLKDLPSKKVLTGYIRQAMKLNDEGIKAPMRRKTAERQARAEATEHPEFTKSLKKNPAASKHYTAFTPGKRREYCEWIAEAKTDATRTKRIDQAVEWIAEGKSRHWKYQK